MCQNMNCIRSSLRCDGHLDCTDGSDELKCSSYDGGSSRASPSSNAKSANSSENAALGVIGFLVCAVMAAIAGYIFWYRPRQERLNGNVRTVTLPRSTSDKFQMKTMASTSNI